MRVIVYTDTSNHGEVLERQLSLVPKPLFLESLSCLPS